MPKKRVGVSLRKPSPAPESAQPSSEASVSAVAAPASAVAAPGSAAQGSAAQGSGAPVFAATAALEGAMAHGNAAVALDLQPEAMLREPSPLEPHAAEAFVNGAAAALERAATELPPAQLQALLQRGPEGYRELTLYLPEKLAQELALHCLEHNLDMNRLVANAVQLHLSGAPSATPEPQGRTSDMPAPGDTLTVAARALLGELAEWVRTVWVAKRRSLLARAGFGGGAT
jgi:hypothetical protein